MHKTLCSILILCSLAFASCTNLNNTQQGALSGAAIGAGAGLGISALTHGRLGTGALIGGGLGAVAGALYGNSQEGR